MSVSLGDLSSPSGDRFFHPPKVRDAGGDDDFCVFLLMLLSLTL